MIAGVLVATMLLWWRNSFVGLGSDDYHYIHALAPIADLGDVIAAFWRADANPQYWRPLANASLMLDFLLYGWQGTGYHTTNLLIHVITTLVVFKMTQMVFGMSDQVSLMTGAAFGIAGCHDINLLWIAARADMLATLCMMLALITLRSQRTGAYALALFWYLLALCAKELGIVLLPMIAIMLYWWSAGPTRRRLGYSLTSTLPFLLITILFFLYRAEFTVPIGDAQPMQGEGMSSPIAMAKNLAYALGYTVLPLDFSTANAVLGEHLMLAFGIGGLLALLALFIIWKCLDREDLRILFPVFCFTVLTSIAALQSFERWRLYAMSVGVFILAAYMVWKLWIRHQIAMRAILRVVAGAWLTFQIMRVIEEQQNWIAASETLQSSKSSLREIFTTYDPTQQPIHFLTLPAKIGGASILKISSSHVVLQALAEARALPELQYGSIGDLKLDFSASLDVISTSADRKFGTVTVARTADGYSVRSLAPSTMLAPRTAMTGSKARELRLEGGDSSATANGLIVTREARGRYAQSALVVPTNKAAAILYFDGSRFRKL